MCDRLMLSNTATPSRPQVRPASYTLSSTDLNELQALLVGSSLDLSSPQTSARAVLSAATPSSGTLEFKTPQNVVVAAERCSPDAVRAEVCSAPDAAATPIRPSFRVPELHFLSELKAPASGVPASSPIKPASLRVRITGDLGQGSFGKVKAGIVTNLGRHHARMVAVKRVEFHEAKLRDSLVLERIDIAIKEAEKMVRLKHRSVVEYLDAGVDKAEADEGKGVISIIMEHCSQGSLHDFLSATKQSFPEDSVRVFAKQLFEGLEYLHANGIIHRDIKSRNILLGDDGHLRLADLGSARFFACKRAGNAASLEEALENVTSVKEALQVTTSFKFTPAYASPEVLTGLKYQANTDVWSLLCVIVELLTGIPDPWYRLREENPLLQPVQLIMAIVMDRRRPQLPLGISRSCADFFAKGFEYDHKKRPSAKDCLMHPWLADAPKSCPPLFDAKRMTIKQFREYLHEKMAEGPVFEPPRRPVALDTKRELVSQDAAAESQVVAAPATPLHRFADSLDTPRMRDMRASAKKKNNEEDAQLYLGETVVRMVDFQGVQTS